MIEDVINFDGDAVSISFRGQKFEMFAADEIDEIHAEMRRLDAGIRNADRLEGPDGAPAKCPDWEDPETGETRRFTHGRGPAFMELLKSHFRTKHGLTAPEATAFAIYTKLLEKKETYEGFFVSGSSSQPPSDSPLPTASADAAAAKRLSDMPADSGPREDSKTSTTASVTPSPASEA